MFTELFFAATGDDKTRKQIEVTEKRLTAILSDLDQRTTAHEQALHSVFDLLADLDKRLTTVETAIAAILKTGSTDQSQ